MFFVEGSFAPSVAYVYGGEGFDEEGCVGGGYVVDDAWYLLAEFGFYLEDKSVGADGYYVVLEGGSCVGGAHDSFEGFDGSLVCFTDLASEGS